jgi:hypothetical protein
MAAARPDLPLAYIQQRSDVVLQPGELWVQDLAQLAEMLDAPDSAPAKRLLTRRDGLLGSGIGKSGRRR